MAAAVTQSQASELRFALWEGSDAEVVELVTLGAGFTPVVAVVAGTLAWDSPEAAGTDAVPYVAIAAGEPAEPAVVAAAWDTGERTEAPVAIIAAPAAAIVASIPATGNEARPASGATARIVCDRGLETVCVTTCETWDSAERGAWELEGSAAEWMAVEDIPDTELPTASGCAARFASCP